MTPIQGYRTLHITPEVDLFPYEPLIRSRVDSPPCAIGLEFWKMGILPMITCHWPVLKGFEVLEQRSNKMIRGIMVCSMHVVYICQVGTHGSTMRSGWNQPI